jgi:hypothetical protein
MGCTKPTYIGKYLGTDQVPNARYAPLHYIMVCGLRHGRRKQQAVCGGLQCGTQAGSQTDRQASRSIVPRIGRA